MTTLRFVVEVTPDEDVPASAAMILAEELLDYLCDGGDGLVEYPSWIASVDSVEPVRDR